MKRQIRALLVTVAGLVTAAGLFWFLWLPSYRPTLERGERYGVDVSHHQGPIDWLRVAADDISFAYIKATEGSDFTDDRFHRNWKGALDARLVRGAYHFFTLCSSGDLQAEHFLHVVPEDPEALPPAVDLELAGNCAARPDAAIVRRELIEYVELVESSTMREVVLYVGEDFEERYAAKKLFGRPLWEPRFLWRPREPRWAVWQVMGVAHVDGIDGKVDLNVMRDL